jgi:ATP-dependent helicase HrpB
LAFDGIALERETVSVKDFASAEDVAHMLASAASRDLGRAFQPDKDGAQLLDRIACLRAWMPELELPDLRAVIPEGEARGERGRTLLEQWCWGKRTFADLRRQSLEGLIRCSLRHDQWSALEQHAPARLQVPSGSHIRIDYTVGEPPVLAVRIQELFGMVKTPTVARGEVALVLHLLAPNYRPAQVTQDLESFWVNTYPEVRKELRARYPKHPWPEDPLTASAIRK